MKHLKSYYKDKDQNSIRKRENELKLGEKVKFYAGPNDLSDPSIRFAILGIPEDVGVRANFGRGGAHTAWKPALDSFLNQQSNSFLNGEDILVLGEIDCDEIMEKSRDLNPKKENDLEKLRTLTAELDKKVSSVIEQVVGAGKIPVIVGGGHNNAYGNLKGSWLALKQKLNVINCDPHADFRPDEGRHSGNGFSYAYKEGFIHKYSILCLHEQYNTSSVLSEMRKLNSSVYFSDYEDVFVRENSSYAEALNRTISFVKDSPCGIEIDLDAITNVPSSAKTSSGISPVQARQYAYKCGRNLKAVYFHIAEGAPILAHLKADNKTGKLIAYLMTDFIKGVKERIV
jgi:formiminoglutamase